VNFVGDLRRQLVVGQGRDQADNALWNALGDRSQVWLAQRWQPSQPIQAPGELFQFAGVAQGIQRARMDPRREGFACAKRAPAFLEDLAG
jgi:hypothetical protein